MAPCCSSHDMPSVLLAAPILGRYVPNAKPLRIFQAHSWDHCFCENRAGMGAPFASMREPGTVGVLNVRGSRDPFKIAGAVVELVPVNVVDLEPGRARPDERRRNKVMDPMAGGRPVSAKDYIKIPSAHGPTEKCADAPRHSPFPSAHPPQAGHLVRPTVDRPPFFSGKLFGSHREPPPLVPVVRPESGATTLPRVELYYRG